MFKKKQKQKANVSSVLRFLRPQGGAGGEAEGFMALAWDTIEQLKALALDLRQQGRPADNVVRT